MRLRPVIWLFISLVCFFAAFQFWKMGDRWNARKTAPPAAAESTNAPAATTAGPAITLLTRAENLTPSTFLQPAARTVYRLANTKKTPGQLLRNDRAILLENALLETDSAEPLKIPEHLKAKQDPGAYIVQASGPIDQPFRDRLQSAGAEIVSYIPNNAYLVRASSAVVTRLASVSGTRAILPYEPYYKLKAALLPLAVDQKPLPEGNPALNVVLFAGNSDQTLQTIMDTGAEVVSRFESPFGPAVRLRAPGADLAALAALPGVLIIEPAAPRTRANDLSRFSTGVAINPQTNANHLGLSGSNILVGVNDSGVDETHPGLQGRVIADAAGSLTDTDGHGTHVAGTIAGSGAMSDTVTNAQGSPYPYTNSQFRGVAPGARIYTITANPNLGPDVSDRYLQEASARTNVFISNNSWVYQDKTDYDLAAASYDAAVRDALPTISGSQPVLFVFPSGNNGNGGFTGSGGTEDTVESPGTAKNVITVGAFELPRDITNEVVIAGQTNQPWRPISDSDNQIASFSGRGNVGIGIEGEFGRFKPDVVAPGTVVISARSAQAPTNAAFVTHVRQFYRNLLLNPGESFVNPLYLPDSTLSFTILTVRNPGSPLPFPQLPIFVSSTEIPTPATYDYLGTNVVTVNNPAPAGTDWFFSVVNTTSNELLLDFATDVTITNSEGTLEGDLGQYYRYESGTSIAAAHVSGMLALLQEFYELRLGRTNSPALMKALLVNGARSLGNQYDFNVSGQLNLQGWGKVNLPNSARSGLLGAGSGVTAVPAIVIDQNLTNTLATGQRQTYTFAVTRQASVDPLRITLTWTDPPGNPVASTKLVNDLDLVVTNLESGEVFFGNDLQPDADYNQAWDTNAVPFADSVNNVENVFLSGPVGTNYSVTVLGRRINVNAVSGHPNDVVQDFALVISSGEGLVTNALSLGPTVVRSAIIDPQITYMTNSYSATPGYYGGTLMNQRVGASTPLLGTNSLDLAPAANGILTLGITNQWHFYVITNANSYTNAAFLTFIPPTLSVPKIGVYQGRDDNATRVEADIDLYVSTDFNLTNLSPAAIAAADKSVSRGGTETIMYSNALPTVYYIGVKSEDQMAAQYSFMGIFSLMPFGTTDEMGNQYLTGFPVPAAVPDATSDGPGGVMVTALGNPMLVRRVIVTNILSHELMGDLLGNLVAQDGTYAVLNNHNPDGPVTNRWYVYDDSDQGDLPEAGHSSGPGSLHDFAGREAGTQWRLNMIDDAASHTGFVDAMKIFLEKQQDLTEGINVSILPGRCREEFIEVPLQATSLTINANLQAGAGPVLIQVCRYDPPGGCSATNNILTTGTSVTIDQFSDPPLTPGMYVVRMCNTGPTVADVYLIAIIRSDIAQIPSSSYSTNVMQTIKDDAVSYSYLLVTNLLQISSIDVGMLINHPRISDLAVTLISPNGTRILLFENRGGTTTTGLGTFSETTNGLGEAGLVITNYSVIYSNLFDAVAPGVYAPGTTIEGWTVNSSRTLVMPDYSLIYRSNNFLVMGETVISNQLPTSAPSDCELQFKVTHAPYLVGTVGWWPLDGNGQDIFGGLDGLVTGELFWFGGKVDRSFIGNGVRSGVVVPANPSIDVGQARGFSVEGWVFPMAVSNAMPLVEWSSISNLAVLPGVQLWLNNPTNYGTCSVYANVWDTNGVAHELETVPLTMTNLGWQHVALTFDKSTGEGRLYVNGQVAASQGLGAVVPNTTADLVFGLHPGQTNFDVSFLGGLDEIGLYERALTPCEVNAIFRSGSNGKYGTNVLYCPVATEVTVYNPGPVSVIFTNGVTWTNGPQWELVSVPFTTTTTNRTPVVIRSLDPNATIDEVLLYAYTTNLVSGAMHFTENTNLAVTPIKFAPTPYVVSNFPPVMVYSNSFEAATQAVYSAGETIPGSFNTAATGPRDWLVVTGQVSVISNANLAIAGTNLLVLSTNNISTELPTVPGHKYELSYKVRGPAAVGWWNGDIEPYSRRARDLIGGDHGAFYQPATNRTDFGAVGTSSLVIGVTSNYTGKIELADPQKLRLTNSFTIEGWIYPTNRPGSRGQILFRGDSRVCFDPYFLAMTSDRQLQFHVEAEKTYDCGVDLATPVDSLVLNQWQHVAAVFEGNVEWQQNAPWLTNEMRLYIDGELVSTNYTGQFPFRELDEAYSPGVAIGNRSRSDFSEPFPGYIDELTVYARALTTNEIAAIAGAGVFGKADAAVEPAHSLAKVTVLLDDLVLANSTGANAEWTIQKVTFTATRTNMLLELDGKLPGTLVGDIALTELPAELRYQPEESMEDLIGQNAFGLWALEIWDTRAGGSTNATPQLLSWELTFQLLPLPPVPTVVLAHGMTYTNRLLAGGSQNLIVPAPAWAEWATNVLLFATNNRTGGPANIGVWFDHTNLPTSTVNAMFWPPVANGMNALWASNTAAPMLLPGQNYYLTVTNPNPYAITYAYGVWFDLFALTNCQPATNFVGPAGVPRYFQFEVPNEAVLPGEPRNVSVWLSGVQSNVTVVMSQHLPLPDLTHYDYISEWPATNGEVVMVVTNSTPFPIEMNRWYIGVFNQADTNVAFTIEACYATNYPTIIDLTNEVAFTVLETTNLWAAPPGPPRHFFFRFEVTNYVNSILFELYGMSGNADLVLQRDLPPTQAPYLRGSFREDRTPEQIVVRPDIENRDLRGQWYLGIYNRETTSLTYTVRAAVPDTNGMLMSGQPVQAVVARMAPPAGLRVRWNAVEGEAYIVEFSPRIINPTWTAISPPIIATSPFPAIEVPVQGTGSGFYRVVPIARASVPAVPLDIQLVSPTLIRLAWPINYIGYRLQYCLNLSFLWIDSTLPITIEGNEFVAYDTIGPIPTLYRVAP